MAQEKTEPEDALIARLVDEAVARYGPLLPPEGLAALREEMEMFARTHPEMRRMVRRLRPRAPVEVSDVVAREGGEAQEGADVSAEGRKVG